MTADHPDHPQHSDYPGRMTSDSDTGPAPTDPPAPAAPVAPAAPARPSRLVFDDPLDGRSADDSDRGWGERSTGSGGDLARFLDEKPPHHI